MARATRDDILLRGVARMRAHTATPRSSAFALRGASGVSALIETRDDEAAGGQLGEQVVGLAFLL